MLFKEVEDLLLSFVNYRCHEYFIQIKPEGVKRQFGLSALSFRIVFG